MRVTCPTAGLLAACQKLQGAAATHAHMPIYRNAKAVANGDLVVMATDLEVGLRLTVPDAAVGETGETVLPLVRLVAILAASPDADVRVSVEDGRADVTTATSGYKLPTDDPTAFADVADFDPGEQSFEMPAGELGRMIRRVVFAAAKDEHARFAMRGVLWVVDGDRPHLVATDGKRLAAAGPWKAKGGKSALIPAKAMRLLEKLLDGADEGEVVRVALRANDAIFKTPQAVVYTRLLEGKFAPYRDAIDRTIKRAKTKVDVPVGAFLSAVRQAAVMSDEDSKRVDLTFEPGKVTLKIATSNGSGEVTAALPVGGHSGPPAALAWEANWPVEAFRQLNPAETVRMEIDDKQAGLVRVGDERLFLITSMIEK